MNSYLQIENLTKSFGSLVLYENVDFELSEGQKVAIVAKNGAGKSTLLNIIAGKDTADAGKITFRNNLRVSFLEQTPMYDPESTVYDAFMAVENSLKEFHSDDWWRYETEAKKIITKLNAGDFDAKISTLSGGQIKRLALANALISEPDLLILDEPTNHLDLEMVEWLEDYLSRSTMSLLMVTHDRYFLDRVCSDIVEIDGGKFYRYKGNYSYYLEKRQQRIDVQNAFLARSNNIFRRELEWMRSTPQARSSKAKGRIDAFNALKEVVSQKPVEQALRLEVKSTYIGSKIFEAKYISKAYEDRVILKDFYYNFARYEKMGIVGNNGTGKSTFLKLLLGQIKPDSGTFDIGETVKFGYYSQEGLKFNEQMKVIDVVRAISDDIDLGGGRRMSASQFLQHFLFTPESQYNYVYKLSGGEKRRLYLCTVLIQNPNFLVLDEPTNDLDIVTLNVLEDYLQNFKGCVIVVSHDRYFMDKVVDHLLVFKGGGVVKDFPGNYTQYREWRTDAEKTAAKEKRNADVKSSATSAPQNATNSRAAERPRRLTYAEKRELEQLTADIDSLEKEKSEIEQFFQNPTDTSAIAAKSKRLQEINTLLDEKELRWLELSEVES
ncbi:MAG: ABC-F family ATP-binding cassette domain-containing protein [Paludibacteraceae bacterium]|nr:ABC-F family ATP-binding cassette domain-containing protein [Paludibacteraceae bacterium]